MTSLAEYYRKDALTRGFQQDAVQEQAVAVLQVVSDAIGVRTSALARFKKKTTAQGLYMWGGVGRGKTYLMDLFFQHLPTKHKRRQHFNHFMQDVHRQLKSHEGKKNPLVLVAKDIAAKAKVICFDEFMVADIADAMILGTLFEHLFTEGVCLVATSNVAPDDLYRDGLQRSRFLPAIAVLKQHVQVMNVDAGIDYRDDAGQIHYYHSPLIGGRQFMLEHLERLGVDTITDGTITLADREVVVLAQSPRVVWFDFAVLCNAPRSTPDYIDIATRFNTVLLSNVRQMDADHDDQARRFITLVDEFYDQNTQLIVSAEVPMSQLYTGKRLAFEFERTRSRLAEMMA